MSDNKVYIDVREPYEYADGHLDSAINIPLDLIEPNNQTLLDIDKSAQIVVYCRSGARAENAKSLLNSLGYQNVTNGINQENIKNS